MVRSRQTSPPSEPTRAEGARSKLVSGSSGNVQQLLADDDDDGNDTVSNTNSEADQHKPATEPLPENERPFGRYTLLRRLAYGGMGEIFLARQGGVGSLSAVAKLVVIKRILGHMKRDEKHRRMFLDEARLQAVLSNQHIVAIHDMGEESGHVYLAMEHVNGPSWRALIDRCRKNREHIPLAHIAAMVAQAARGLSYAHNLVDVTGARLRIVHRDINPHNILVSYDGEVKIIDFGIAKSDLADGNTETGTIKGKFSYMSPEQSAADPLDARSDIFTLGICLYEMCTLENPFRKSNVVLSLESIQRDEPPPLAKKRKDAAIFQAIVDRCLAKDRDDRFDDCADIAVALEALVANGLVPDAPEPLGAWLKARFRPEIAEHLHILEQTGSSSAVVVAAHSNPNGSSPFKKPPSSRASGELRLPDRRNPGVDPNAMTRSTIAPDPSEFTAMPEVPEIVEQTSQTPAESYDVSAVSKIAVVAEKPPPRPTRVPMIAAGVFLVVVVGIAAGIGVAFAIEPKQAHAILDRVVNHLDRSDSADSSTTVPSEQPVDPSHPLELATATNPPKPPVDVDPPKETVPPPVDAAPVIDTAPPVEPPPVETPPADTPPEKKAVKKAPKEAAAKEAREAAAKEAKEAKEAAAAKEAKEAVASVSVTSEGFAVKGGRKVYAGEATVLTIDKADGAPFGVKFRVRESGFDVDTDPWAIVRVDGLGKGRTPQKAVALPANRAVSVELVNPGAGKMVVTLKLTPK